MEKIYSHPDKGLEQHLNGVKKNAERRGYKSDILDFVCLFHDIAKTNINFQHKLFNTPYSGYSNHGMLSVYISFLLIVKNKQIQKKYNFNNDLATFNIISNIIMKHHGNLKNIDEILLSKDSEFNVLDISQNTELNDMIDFINGTPDIPFIEFMKEKYPDLYDQDFQFENNYNNNFRYFVYSNKKTLRQWQLDPLKNYYDTLFNFGLLIEGDKRDASNNTINILDDIGKFNYLFNNNINKFLSKLTPNNKLNQLRTDIRNDANDNLIRSLNNSDQRMFEVTSPTGSGKTFMMLKLAATIQNIKGDYGIILSLPFTSIIDQTASIIEDDLLIDVLKYTSVSEASDKIKNISKANENDLLNLIQYKFSEDTFDNPFIVTTFVQFFQTLISNGNSSLIKLPNFSKRIFLIDEFQGLNTSMYNFFYGMLQYFCYRFDCYCIICTATMPNFELNKRYINRELKIKAEDIFKKYSKPTSLLNTEKYYNDDIFNRYQINNIGDKNINELVDNINKSLECDSTLVVMNTIQDSIDVYSSISYEKKYLLNSNFTAVDKIRIINNVKTDLKNNVKILLISTQVIEAGVDVDFPIVYRDLCPLSSLIQTSGRCNRNGKLRIGNVYLFKFFKQQNERKYRCDLVYRDNWDLEFIENNITSQTEKELFQLQKKYYTIISEHKVIGNTGNKNLLDLVYRGRIEELYFAGKLIENKENEFTYYVGKDDLFNLFSDKYNEIISLGKIKDFNIIKKHNIELENINKQIMKYCVSITINPKKFQQPLFSGEIMGIRNLANKFQYSNEFGFDKTLINNQQFL